MKSLSELQKIAKQIEDIVFKSSNNKIINRDDQAQLEQKITDAGAQFFDLPFNKNLLDVAAENQNIDLLCLLKMHYSLRNDNDRIDPTPKKLDQLLAAIDNTSKKNNAALSILEQCLLGNNSDQDPLVIASKSKNIVLLKKLIPAYIKLSKINSCRVYQHGINATRVASTDVISLFREYPEFLNITIPAHPYKPQNHTIGFIICSDISDQLLIKERTEMKAKKTEEMEKQKALELKKQQDEEAEDSKLLSEVKELEKEKSDLEKEKSEAHERKQMHQNILSLPLNSPRLTRAPQTEYKCTYSASNFGRGLLVPVVIIGIAALCLCIADQATDGDKLSNTFNSITHWLWGSFCKQSSEPNAGHVVSMVLLGGSMIGAISGSAGMLIGGKTAKCYSSFSSK